MTACIQTVGLTKKYGDTRAVTNLDLAVDPGQVFGFLGPNGAGKTTTIRMLLALQRPTTGRASVLGLDARSESVEIHRRVGYLPGDLQLYARMTGNQLIDWFARARELKSRSLANQLVERFSVVTNRPVRELSKGNRQKIGLVLAFMHEPELLILDEPTSGLDPLMQAEFETLVRETVGSGRSLFLSSHDLDEVQRLADRVAIIKDGELVATDTVAALRSRAPMQVEARFDTPVERAVFDGLDGVSVAECDGTRLVLVVSGRIGPVLRLIADRDPADVVSRHADLDELFLQFYRGTPPTEASHAD